MPTLEDSTNTYLLAQSALTAYVGNRIYWIDSDQEETQDYIRFHVVSPRNEMRSFGDVTSSEPLVQFDIFSRSASNALAIGNILITLLHGFNGALGTGGNTVTTSSADGPMVMVDESAPGWYHGIVDWRPLYIR